MKKTVGVDNVCEKRAVCAVGAKITEKKTALNGTALALGRINTEIDFFERLSLNENLCCWNRRRKC